MQIEYWGIGTLCPHEETLEARLGKMVEKIQANDYFHKPILVDAVSKTILDGHHKWAAAIVLSLDYLPVLAVDYLQDERIEVAVWQDCGKDSITKQEVVEMALGNRLFAAKTSKHVVAFEIPSIETPLSRLRSQGRADSVV
jgi:ParB-like chromosome segregation protein Spo0J